MSKKLKIKIGTKFSKLEIVEEVFWRDRRYFKCKCDCWTYKIVRLNDLRNWKTKSCWCLRLNWIVHTTHWMNWTKIYRVFVWIKNRCNNKNERRYKDYWWRWIKCEWNSFEEFYEDMKEWYSENLQIDRIDNDLNYCKENCRWITAKENCRNRRTNIIYKWKCLTEWCEKLWLHYWTIHSRIYKYNYSVKEALNI